MTRMIAVMGVERMMNHITLHVDDVPVRPPHIDGAANGAFGRKACVLNTIGVPHIVAARHFPMCEPLDPAAIGQAGPVGTIDKIDGGGGGFGLPRIH
ncbi:hypothetical protein [Burkholderia guangdongensis]|uniref:hypothetical protein n=1 Tax=Burkholderia guangdongensis TaxID=1792500 RepID=UPI0015CBE9C6|nr:hypothetical protein [Burkholderia guangdongensis]